jgi:hypothetical protein
MAGMVTENEVWAAARKIRARGAPPGGMKERVSVRSVRKELGGGSFSDIARSLGRWKVGENYHPVIERADLPEAFESRLAAFGRDILEQARLEATRERLSDFAEVERLRREYEEILAEAAERVDHLEDKIAGLQAELDCGIATGGAGSRAAAAADAAASPVPPAEGMRGCFEAVTERKVARDAEAFWAEVRAAVEAQMRERGPMPLHAIYRALPASLRQRGESVGFPLTAAWLRYHLLRLTEAGGWLSEVEGRFGLAPPAPVPDVPPEPTSEDAAAGMGRRRFWRRFVHQVHDLLVKDGPLSTEDILCKLPSEWVAVSGRFQRITPGRLRYKLRQRIDEDRPFEELADGRFAALVGEIPWDGEGAMSGTVRNA